MLIGDGFMEKAKVKEELIKRYKYIYENATIILAPYMYEQTKEEREKLNSEYKKDGYEALISDKLLIYLKKLPVELLLDLESFLLSDVPLNESKLYNELEAKKKNPEYLAKVKNGLLLLEKDNANKSSLFQTKLDFWKVLLKVRDFVNEQSGDLKNKEKKLSSLDEYFRINRYSNNEKVWTSGFSINFKDMDNFSSFSAVVPKHERTPRRDKNDIGLKKSDFISFVSDYSNHYDDNFSILTEQEKQDIYLIYHDELPWNLEKTCELEEEYISTMIETRLERPEHTKSCGEVFFVNEEEIFIDPNDVLYRYYQLCPHCGYIVNIPKEILSDGIKQRIEERCKKDSNLFRKRYLYSELFSLDKSSSKEQKKLLKKIVKF